MRILFVLIFLLSSNAFANTSNSDILTILEKEFGVAARLYSTQDFGRAKYNQAISIIIPEKSHKFSLFQLRKKLPENTIAYIGTTRNLSNDKTEGVELVVLMSNDKFDILRASNSDGINHGLTNENIIKKLEDWDKKYTIDIWHAETDTIQLTLKYLPQNLASFAQEVYEFCPDIIDQGSGNISDISDYLNAQHAIYLWWD